MSKYKFKTTERFDKDLEKLLKRQRSLEVRVIEALVLLKRDPFYKSLRTHKVNTRSYGIRYSSRVTGDIRIIWDFFEGKTIIIAITIGGHSGKRGVYN